MKPAQPIVGQLADQYTVGFPTDAATTTVDEGASGTIAPTVALTDLPDGTTVAIGPAGVANLPAGVSVDIDADTGELTVTAGDLEGSRTLTVPVVYTYPDKSTTTVPVSITLNDTTPPATGSSGSSDATGESGELSGGAIAGIVIAVLALLGLLCFGAQPAGLV